MKPGWTEELLLLVGGKAMERVARTLVVLPYMLLTMTE